MFFCVFLFFLCFWHFCFFSGIFNLAFGDSPGITGPADGLRTLLIRFHLHLYPRLVPPHPRACITGSLVTSRCLGSIAVLLGAALRFGLGPSTKGISGVPGLLHGGSDITRTPLHTGLVSCPRYLTCDLPTLPSLGVVRELLERWVA